MSQRLGPLAMAARLCLPGMRPHKVLPIENQGAFQCNRCRAQISITAGTIFASTKLSLTTWFLSIYLITQSKISVSVLSLKRTIGVSYNTALLVKHKIQQVMKERDDSKPLDAEYIQVDDAYWGGKKRDGKRGRGATGKIPFVAAVSISDKGHPLAIPFSQTSAFSKEAITNWAQKYLAPKQKVVTDGLECFTAFKESGLECIAIITGGGPQSVEMIKFKWVNTIIGNVKNSLHGTSMRSVENIFLATSPSFTIDSTDGITWSRWLLALGTSP